MLQKNQVQNNFPKALKTARLAQGLNQESFSLVSSRTYISSLERGLKVPTLNKADELAHVLDIHPLTLIALSYLTDSNRSEIDSLLQKVASEMCEILQLQGNCI